MGAHDSRYRLLFSYPRLIRDLLQGFVREDWVKGLDLSSLERVNGSFVRPDQRQRHGDMVWRARLRTEIREEEWLYVYVLVEFQSNPERFMAVRVLGYIVGLLEDLIRRKELAPGGLLPPVTALVCYRGQLTWTSPRSLRSLFAPVPASLRRHLPELSFRLLDARRMTPEESEDLESNVVASLFQVEAAKTMEDLAPLLEQVALALPPGEDLELRRALSGFLRQVLQESFPGVIIPESSDLEDLSMLEHNMQLWRKKEEKKHREEGLRKGRQEGRQEGQIEGMQELLLDVLKQRFGGVSRDTRRQVKKISSPEELKRLAREALRVETLSELGLG